MPFQFLHMHNDVQIEHKTLHHALTRTQLQSPFNIATVRLLVQANTRQFQFDQSGPDVRTRLQTTITSSSLAALSARPPKSEVVFEIEVGRGAANQR